MRVGLVTACGGGGLERLVGVVVLLLEGVLLLLGEEGLRMELGALCGEVKVEFGGCLEKVDRVAVGAEADEPGGEGVVDALEAVVDAGEVVAVCREVADGVCEVCQLDREVCEWVLCGRRRVARRRVRQRVGAQRGRRQATQGSGRALRPREGRCTRARRHVSVGAKRALPELKEQRVRERGATRARKLGDEREASVHSSPGHSPRE